MQFDNLQRYEPLYGLNMLDNPKKNNWPQMFGPIKIDINCQCRAPEDGEVIQFFGPEKFENRCRTAGGEVRSRVAWGLS